MLFGNCNDPNMVKNPCFNIFVRIFVGVPFGICFHRWWFDSFQLALVAFGFWWLLAVGCWLLVAVGFWWLLTLGGFWLVVAFGFWRLLAFGGCWLLVAFGFWRLVVALAFRGFVCTAAKCKKVLVLSR